MICVFFLFDGICLGQAKVKPMLLYLVDSFVSLGLWVLYLRYIGKC